MEHKIVYLNYFTLVAFRLKGLWDTCIFKTEKQWHVKKIMGSQEKQNMIILGEKNNISYREHAECESDLVLPKVFTSLPIRSILWLYNKKKKIGVFVQGAKVTQA